jgi:thymidylate synthase (FAD)
MEFETIKILNAGEIDLLDCMGNDLSIVNAAKVSFASYEQVLNDKSKGLINFLVKNKHATPFEHVVFKFHIKCPIFVAREWFRHRWSSFNEMSMRYHQPASLDYYTPTSDKIRKQVGKPGAYSFEEITDPEVKDAFYSIFQETVLQADEAYYKLIDLGIAKELARCVLPVTQYTEFIWTVNARSLMNFMCLRNDSNAQYEIAEYAKEIENIFGMILPATYNSWVANGRESI